MSKPLQGVAKNAAENWRSAASFAARDAGEQWKPHQETSPSPVVPTMSIEEAQRVAAVEGLALPTYTPLQGFQGVRSECLLKGMTYLARPERTQVAVRSGWVNAKVIGRFSTEAEAALAVARFIALVNRVNDVAACAPDAEAATAALVAAFPDKADLMSATAAAIVEATAAAARKKAAWSSLEYESGGSVQRVLAAVVDELVRTTAATHVAERDKLVLERTPKGKAGFMHVCPYFHRPLLGEDPILAEVEPYHYSTFCYVPKCIRRDSGLSRGNTPTSMEAGRGMKRQNVEGRYKTAAEAALALALHRAAGAEAHIHVFQRYRGPTTACDTALEDPDQTAHRAAQEEGLTLVRCCDVPPCRHNRFCTGYRHVTVRSRYRQLSKPYCARVGRTVTLPGGYPSPAEASLAAARYFRQMAVSSLAASNVGPRGLPKRKRKASELLDDGKDGDKDSSSGAGSSGGVELSGSNRSGGEHRGSAGGSSESEARTAHPLWAFVADLAPSQAASSQDGGQERTLPPRCAICLDSFGGPPGDASCQGGWGETKCGHLYHYTCLGTWLQSSEYESACPQCRVPLSKSTTRMLVGSKSTTADSPVLDRTETEIADWL